MALTQHIGSRWETVLAIGIVAVSTMRCPAPQIICGAQCADLNGDGVVSSRDFLLLMSEYGQTIQQAGLSKACLDSRLSEDGYVDVCDVFAFDALVGFLPPPNACGPLTPPVGGGPSPLMPSRSASSEAGSAMPQSSTTSSTLVIAGKSSITGQQSDALYTLDTAALITTGGCLGADASPPAGGVGTRGNGRLVKDSVSNVYQLNTAQGLVQIGGIAVIPSHYFSSVSTESDVVQVHVGVNAPGGYYSGLPLADAAFSPTDPSIVYVLPVLVTPMTGCPYKAAAKLHLGAGGSYSVVTLYGRNPASYSSVQPDPDLGCDFYLPEPDREKLREIQVDALGHVFVLAAQGASPQNDWLLIYDEAVGNASEHAEMISNVARAPTALLVSSSNRLYVASSVDPVSNSTVTVSSVPTRVYRFDITCYSGSGNCLSPLTSVDVNNSTDAAQDRGYGYFARITAIKEDPADGKIYVTGFTAPRFSPTETFPSGNTDPLFTRPTLVSFDPSPTGPVTANAITCHNLALPLSMVFGSVTGTVVADFNGDGHVDSTDFDQLKKCSTRSGVPYNPAALPTGCTLTPDAQGRLPADFDKDGDVDMNDFAKFQRCYSGPNASPDPACGN